MVAGRPREYDREKIMEELIEWVKLDDSLNICGFAGPRFIEIDKFSLFSRECEKFRRVYHSVKMIIGERREKMMNAKLLDANVYNRNAHTYDAFMRQTYHEDKEFESTLKQKENKALPVGHEQVELLRNIVEANKNLVKDG